MVWFNSFEIFVRVRTNEQFSWPIFASPELEFSYTFEHCITKAFYCNSSHNLLLVISLTFVKYLVRISFKGSPLRRPLRKEHPITLAS